MESDHLDRRTIARPRADVLFAWRKELRLSQAEVAVLLDRDVTTIRCNENPTRLAKRQRLARNYYQANKETIKEKAKQHRAANQNYYRAYQEAFRENIYYDNELKRQYGIAVDDYRNMLESQFGKCAICRSSIPGPVPVSHFRVDHCHATGIIRGLLCDDCNLGIGHFRDDVSRIESAQKWLTYEPKKRASAIRQRLGTIEVKVLTTWRKEFGLDIAAAARLLGIPTPTYRYLERKGGCRAVINGSPLRKMGKRDARNPIKDAQLRCRYGISFKEYEELLELQDGRCGICHGQPNQNRRLNVDHNHTNGDVRGLLCRHCNNGLGNFHDDISFLVAAAQYLRRVDQSVAS